MLDIARELSFLNKLKELSITLSFLKSNDVIDAIKRCIINHQELIPDDIQSVVFIEKLIDISEKNATREDITSFLAEIATFWKWLILRRPLEFIYVGQRSNYYIISGIFGGDSFVSHKVIFVDDEEVDNEIYELKNSILYRPILITDKCGQSKFDGKDFLGVINIEREIELVDGYLTYAKVIHDHIDMIDILNNNIKRLNDDSGINKIILGSSFAYYGIPDSLLTYSANLSIASGDPSYDKALLEHCMKKHGVKDYVIVIGFFELFHELAKGANGYFHLASTFLKENNIPYTPRGCFSETKGPFLFDVNRNTIVDMLGIDATTWILGNKINTLRKNRKRNPQKSQSTDFSYSTFQLRRETDHFAKFYSREGVAEYNKNILQSMVNDVKQAGGHIYFVIQPFTKYYNAHFHPLMRKETKEFLASITDGESSFFIDMSEDPEFGPEDFSDAHHLNYTGATKLFHKLEWLKL